MSTLGQQVCVLSPDVTQGPYYLSSQLVRKDITEGKPGLALTMNLSVVDHTNGCTPVGSVPVKIWHCDAWGYYSGSTSTSPGGTVPALRGEHYAWHRPERNLERPERARRQGGRIPNVAGAQSARCNSHPSVSSGLRIQFWVVGAGSDLWSRKETRAES
jgi:hypothetical protein